MWGEGRELLRQTARGAVLGAPALHPAWLDWDPGAAIDNSVPLQSFCACYFVCDMAVVICLGCS